LSPGMKKMVEWCVKEWGRPRRGRGCAANKPAWSSSEPAQASMVQTRPAAMADCYVRVLLCKKQFCGFRS
jgi:hypothetical protein